MAKKQQELKNLEKQWQSYKELKEEYKTNQAAFEKLGIALPEEEDIPGLLVQLENLARQSGLQPLSLRLEEGKEAKIPGVSELRIVFSVGGGTYPLFKRFLAAVEENLRLIDVLNVNFSLGATTFTLQMRTYYLGAAVASGDLKFQKELLTDPAFLQLKATGELPVKPGTKGKENPFLGPEKGL